MLSQNTGDSPSPIWYQDLYNIQSCWVEHYWYNRLTNNEDQTNLQISNHSPLSLEELFSLCVHAFAATAYSHCYS